MNLEICGGAWTWSDDLLVTYCLHAEAPGQPISVERFDIVE
jgi:hypothetical protein